MLQPNWHFFADSTGRLSNQIVSNQIVEFVMKLQESELIPRIWKFSWTNGRIY